MPAGVSMSCIIFYVLSYIFYIFFNAILSTNFPYNAWFQMLHYRKFEEYTGMSIQLCILKVQPGIASRKEKKNKFQVNDGIISVAE